MSRKANPAIVGSFVLGAVILAVAGVFFFGGGKFFRETETYVAYFDGSLKGLDVGSPVTFRGVRVGTVKGVSVVYDVTKSDLTTPVIFEIDLNSLEVIGASEAEQQASAAGEDDSILVKRGLRAQLQMRSLVTGQLAVNLDFFPDSKIVKHGRYKGHTEFPTVPSEVEKFRDFAQQFLAQLHDIPVGQIADDLRGLLESMKKLVASPELEGAIRGADDLMNSPDLQASLKSLRAALQNADEAMQSVRRLADNADDQIAPLAEGMRGAADDLDKLLTEATRVFRSVESSVSDGSEMRVRAVSALEEVARAARSVRVLADYLERHPEALLTGKKEAGR